MSIPHRSNTPQRTIHRHNNWTSISSQVIYNRARSIGKFRNSEFLNQQSRNRPLTNKFRTNIKRFSKRFYQNTKKLTTKSEWNRRMDIDESYKYDNKRKYRKVKQVAKNAEAAQIHDIKPQILSKWITSHTESYHFYRRSTNKRRKSYKTQLNDLENYSNQLKSSQNNIKSAVTLLKQTATVKINTDSAETHSEEAIDGDNSNTSSIYSNEKEILDVRLLNRLLNVTTEESSENNKALNFSIETDDDVEILKHLKEVLYEK